MMDAPATHIRKRQYQPTQSSITNFFGRGFSGPLSPRSPSLPEETQASLLSVGMRVRKSVPEGYKTHKTLGSQGFPFPSSAPPASTSPAFSSPRGNPEASRELTPFCGLFKIGGLAAQEFPSSSAPPAVYRDACETDFQPVPGLSMSQNSALSSQERIPATPPIIGGMSRKRVYEEEMEDSLDAFFDEMNAPDIVLSNPPDPSRPIARIKSALQKPPPSQDVQVHSENDFEEAGFLKPRELMELDG